MKAALKKDRMKLTALTLGALTTAALLGSAQYNPSQAAGYSLQREKRVAFQPSLSDLRSGKIQYFFEILEQNEKVSEDDRKANDSTSESQALRQFLLLDTQREYKAGQYYIAMAKVAYLVKRDISTFTAKSACDLNSLRRLSPEMEITSANGPCDFKIEGSFENPSMNLSVQWFENGTGSHRPAPQNYLHFEGGELASITPDKSAFQRNFNFGRWLKLIKTAKSASTLTHYYGVEKGETLVINYSINFLYNLPPGKNKFLSILQEKLPVTVQRMNQIPRK